MHRYDFTLRAQILERAWNPEYYALIEAFGRRTGTYAVLNTSFNLHGEPIVGGPADAIRTLDRSGLRYGCLNGYLLEKKT
jgi:carbamoyltransferase